MFISADFQRLEQHQEHLKQELEVAKELIQCLEDEYRKAPIQSSPDYVEVLEEQIQFMQYEVRCIELRSSLLKNIMNELKKAVRQLDETVIWMNGMTKK